MHQWPIFNDKVKMIVQQQQQEVEKALIGCGEYQLRSNYSYLAVPELQWFKMSQQQREEKIHKLNTCSVHKQGTTYNSTEGSEATDTLQCINIGRFNLECKSFLSVCLEDVVDQMTLPYSTFEGIWNKASVLVSEVNAVVPAPGCGPKDMMVKSTSGSAPHLVTTVDNGVTYKCDDKCLHYKSVNLCSHVVVVSRPAPSCFDVVTGEGSGDIAVQNVCNALRNQRPNQIARTTCGHLSHVTGTD
jgi:hypothetical protein